jgi:DNA repair exonuclease SbcCD ATPase subunit
VGAPAAAACHASRPAARRLTPPAAPAAPRADQLLHKAAADLELSDQLRKEATQRAAEATRRALELERRLREAEESGRAAANKLAEAQEALGECEARVKQLQEQLAGERGARGLGGGVGGGWHAARVGRGSCGAVARRTRAVAGSPCGWGAQVRGGRGRAA